MLGLSSGAPKLNSSVPRAMLTWTSGATLVPSAPMNSGSNWAPRPIRTRTSRLSWADAARQAGRRADAADVIGEASFLPNRRTKCWLHRGRHAMAPDLVTAHPSPMVDRAHYDHGKKNRPADDFDCYARRVPAFATRKYPDQSRTDDPQTQPAPRPMKVGEFAAIRRALVRVLEIGRGAHRRQARRSFSTIRSAASSAPSLVVSIWISACSGGSYGLSMPVKFLSSPARALA